ncbi:MAG: hypothetical protein HY293_15820 [Planctomycetes bacterium]|nr:hypothetical protein [Planctomycetota bacterium]
MRNFNTGDGTIRGAILGSLLALLLILGMNLLARSESSQAPSGLRPAAVALRRC